ncbi:MAG: iron-containing alcohol dehydrogenase [Planctomycetaceae bacterium]|nr:iron-containing alcohol dehydrogenase [Planctomycetaceae bacterium]
MRTRIGFSPGSLARQGDFARELGAQRVLVTSDPGIVAAGHTGRGVEILRDAGCAVEIFDRIQENPTSADIEAGAAVAREFSPDLLVGLGGGSSMDCAKGINFVHSCGGRIQDYLGIGKATGPLLPMIAVPTTAGTGSESQSFALISDAETHIKMACGDKRAACKIALLDPELTLTQPPRVTALTGIDAVAHALETYVTKARNPISLTFSRTAWAYLSANFARVLDHPADLDARGGMQLGACLAGLAIENSMLGATHALANPLTAHYGIVHGQAISMMLPHVVRFNARQCGDWYRELLAADVSSNGRPHGSADPGALAELVTELSAKAGLPATLRECGVDEATLETLAGEAARQWTGGFNPRPVGRNELLELYRAAY